MLQSASGAFTITKSDSRKTDILLSEAKRPHAAENSGGRIFFLPLFSERIFTTSWLGQPKALRPQAQPL